MLTLNQVAVRPLQVNIYNSSMIVPLGNRLGRANAVSFPPQVCNKYSIYFSQCLPPCENGSGEYTCTSSSMAATSTSSLKATSIKTTLSTSTIFGTTSTPSYTTTPIVSTTTSLAITYVTPWGQCKILQYNDQEYPSLTQT
jgi:hypothetical protein